MNLEYEKIRLFTLTALKNLNAETNFVQFSDILEEVKRIRTISNLKPEDSNTENRVRRALVNTVEVAQRNNSIQAKELSIMAMHPQYMIIEKNKIDRTLTHKKIVEQEKQNAYKLIENSNL